MSFSIYVDVAIGLALTYLLFSIVASGIQEWLAVRLNRRGKMLEEAIAGMLDGARRGSVWARLPGFFQSGRRLHHAEGSLAAELLAHGRIWALMRDDRIPSYLPPQEFAAALVDVLRDRMGDKAATVAGLREAVTVTLPPGTARQALESLLRDAGDDMSAARGQIAAWYSRVMDRVTGWYTREVRVLLFAVGCVLAMAVNIDTIYLARRLATDQALRENLVRAADAQLEAVRPAVEAIRADIAAPAPTPDEIKQRMEAIGQAADEALKKIPDLKLPIGWDFAALGSGQPATGAAQVQAVAQSYALMPIGWIITGLALALGAPFWFDLLQQLLRLRVVGVKPERIEGAPTTADVSADAAASVVPTMGALGNAASVPGASPPASPLAPEGPANAFERGWLSAFDVTNLQRGLGIATTGVLDAATRIAICTKQARAGLPADGLLSRELTSEILRRLR